MKREQANGKTTQDSNEPEIRVTDRRRIYLNDEGARGGQPQPQEQPRLKPTYVEELEARTTAAENKLQEIQSRFEQARAELQRETDETRKRLNRAADERAEREKANFIAGLLPVLDNLQLATEAAKAAGSTEELIEGVRRIADVFERALLTAGVAPIEALGQPFNPEFHEAVETTNVDEAQDNIVLNEYTRGYTMGDRLLRPARVNVGRSSMRSDSATQS